MTYGTFRPDENGELYPALSQVRRDFASMRDHGFTVVRTYTVPPDRVLESAEEQGLQVLAGVFFKDWRYLVGNSRRHRRTIEREAERTVRMATERLAGCAHVLGLCLGNEVPADVIRWFGPSSVSRTITGLARTARDADPARLLTYGNYPTSEYLAPDDLDFVTFNIFLDRKAEFRRYLTRLQHLADGRPLVVGELGADASGRPNGEALQASAIDWQLQTAVERGVAGFCVFSWTDDWWVGGEQVRGWRFGLTRGDRSPRPALEVARLWNERSVSDIGAAWPSISVVVCAYNAAATLKQCLTRLCALDYPDFEVLVIDDGSTDATAGIARSFNKVRVISIEHAGLSAARNEGIRSARGELVAFLDSDAFPSPEWLHYLALGMDGKRVGGVGGPNLAPASDPRGAQGVARAPGGPAHVLLSDDRAEHIPGCNMAFWRDVLVELGGFDPIFTSAGDDVDLCWRLLDRGWEIGFHPAAFVWHHPRTGARAYLQQQRGYGRSEALVAARHPDRFTAAGAARWRGSIYGGGRPRSARFTRQRVYRGQYGSAAYQSVYRGGGHLSDLVHQTVVPTAWASLVAAPLVVLSLYVSLVCGLGVAILVSVGAADAIRCRPPPSVEGRIRFRLYVALLHLLQPVARLAGRCEMRPPRPSACPTGGEAIPTAQHLSRTAALLREDRDRAELVDYIVGRLRGAGIRVLPGTAWEPFDARTSCCAFARGVLVTSSHPPGWVQVRLRMRPRWPLVATAVVLATALWMLVPLAAVVVMGAAVIDTIRGGQRLRRTLRSALRVVSK